MLNEFEHVWTCKKEFVDELNRDISIVQVSRILYQKRLHTEDVAGATLELLRHLQNVVILKGRFSWKAVEKRLHDMVPIVG